MGAFVTLKINDKLYLKDPVETELGRKIVGQSVVLIDKMGFELFTFKKLAQVCDTTEASIYRYFENKHQLLLFLTSWYWGYIDFKIEYGINNIRSPRQRLKLILKIISEQQVNDLNGTFLSLDVLQKIIVSEATKSYLVKNVDDINKYGAFAEYKNLCTRISKAIQEAGPKTRYAKSIASMLLEAARQQQFFAEHLPGLTDIRRNRTEETTQFLEHIVFKLIEE
ncbi:MAG: TetR/AcrR family transcriptional regulator [Sediminibacterium sp.]|nr:TetR/AcrR family transcriptional regulator [Sediminibacterium sp.]